jgi:hypothetical protein
MEQVSPSGTVQEEMQTDSVSAKTGAQKARRKEQTRNRESSRRIIAYLRKHRVGKKLTGRVRVA